MRGLSRSAAITVGHGSGGRAGRAGQALIGLDTNILVRLVTNDDPVQSPKAAAIVAGADVFISRTVLLEAEWVLRHAYGLDVAAIGTVFDRLLSTASVSVESADDVRRAVTWFQAGMDFADALHLAGCPQTTERFVTFDKKLVKRAASTDGSIEVALG